MRVKTDARRNAILAAATDIFREVGYARASMAMISARLGGSNGTLYGYFKSKEELFGAAMMEGMEGQAADAVRLLDASEPDIALVLRRFGMAYLALLTSADAVAIMRTAIAEGANSKLGKSLYDAGCGGTWAEVKTYLTQLQTSGAIRGADNRFVAAHLKGLLEAGIIEPPLYGAEPWFDTEQSVAFAVDAFLRAYAI